MFLKNKYHPKNYTKDSVKIPTPSFPSTFMGIFV